MTCHILGCGPTGAYMVKEIDDYVIGVNDANKWGHKMNELLFINRPSHFSPVRQETIYASKVTQIVTIGDNAERWKAIFPDTTIYSLPNLTRWKRSISPGIYYHTNNSPFTAMSYAFTLDFTDIVLWGVDFIDHAHLKPQDCAPAFSQFAMESIKLGARIWKGHKMSNLNLPVWKSEP